MRSQDDIDLLKDLYYDSKKNDRLIFKMIRNKIRIEIMIMIPFENYYSFIKRSQ